jgi:DNA gyrase inhibitor GyrI
MIKPILLMVGGIFLAIPVVWLILNSRWHTGTAPYVLVRTDGAFEFRDYPALTLAMAPMENDEGSSRSFRALFQFITGENSKREKIPMTTPVLIDPAPGKRTMSFVMPQAMVRQGVPEPNGDKVRLGKIEAGLYVVLRFKGREAEAKAAVIKLQTWLREHNLVAEGEPMVAYYDPPWTPMFLRRNEVMVRVAGGK